jgi:hypothetical protein
MTLKSKVNIWSYLIRFTAVYILTVLAVTVLFILVKNAIPAESRVALDFFEPYKLGFSETVVIAIRGLVIALVLYPFYDLIVRHSVGVRYLFAALWGLVLFASMEPAPGTIEGFIYTKTTIPEHLLVMAAAALQVAIFCKLYLYLEKVYGQQVLTVAGRPGRPESVRHGFFVGNGYLFRFAIMHLLVYIAVGSLFYQVAGYEEALASMEEFTLWRDLESMGMVAAVFFGQVFRGLFIAIMVAPFYESYLKKRSGWFLLFALLFGLKVLVILIQVPELPIKWSELIIGIPEITVQTFVFSILFFGWERRRERKRLTAAVQQ